MTWQVMPGVLPDMLTSGDAFGVQHAVNAMLKMKKFGIATLAKGYENSQPGTAPSAASRLCWFSPALLIMLTGLFFVVADL